MNQKSLLATGLLAAMGLSPLRAAQPEIWFCPLDDAPRVGPGYTGVPQYMDLFKADAPWPKAASHVKVFKIYHGWIEQASDADLQKQFADLKRRGMDLALEYDVLMPESEADKNKAGFASQSLLTQIARIEKNGGHLKYLTMDEPFVLGLAQYPEPVRKAIPDIVANATKNIKEALAVHPDLIVGDIEPVGPSELKQMLACYREGWEGFAKAGVPLAFFVADVDWYKPYALRNLRAIRDAAHASNMKFGMIYDGDPQDPSDAAWNKTTISRMAEYESALGTPEFATIQTWHPWPKKMLPETDADAMTHLVNVYARPRTELTFSVHGRTLTGKLVTSDGKPVAGASVQVTEQSLAAPGVIGEQTMSGTVPPGCTGVCFGVWSTEEGWSGTDSIRVQELKVETDKGWSTTRTFPEPTFNAWGGLGGSRITQADGTLNIAPTIGQRVEFNSPRVPADISGQTFTYTVKAQVPLSAENTSSIGAFFLSDHSEVWRAIITLQPATTPIGTAVTKADGTWSTQLSNKPGQNTQIGAQFAGDDKYWPAQYVAPAPSH